MRRGRELVVAITGVALLLPASTNGPRAAATPAPADRAPTRSDFNGDGFSDLAVGVTGEDVRGVENAGIVQVLYGSVGGIQAEAPDDQVWHQDSAGVRGTGEFFDRFGAALAHADFNADGFSDLAIGIDEDVNGVPDSGAVAVLYGSPLGLQADSPDDQRWTQDSPGVEDQVETDEPRFGGDDFGAALAGGDFNGDGFADLAIGAPYEAHEGVVEGWGAVNLLFGSPEGLQAEAPADQFWHQGSPGVDGEIDGLFGAALAAGDFNFDGFEDLVVGAYHQSIAGKSDAGAAHVLYGSAGGLQVDAPEDQFWHQDVPGVADSPQISDAFGYAFASGDFNGDPFMDLAIGVVGEDVNLLSGTGAVEVLYGSAAGLQTESPQDQFWHQDIVGVEDEPEPHDVFGWALAAADFDADGFSDLAISVPGEEPNEVFGAGAAHVLYGSAGGLQVDAPEDQFWHQDAAGVEDNAESGDGLGHDLRTDDYNGDGRADLAMRATFEDIGRAESAGAVNVLYGSLAGLQTASPEDQFWHQDQLGVLEKAEPVDVFGVLSGR